MHQPQPPHRKLRFIWIAGGIILLFVGWFFYQLFGPSAAIVVSKETTYITEPLGPDGLPDYEAYLLQQGSEGVTPENNAAVLIWQAMWPGDLAQEHWLLLCEELGIKEIPSSKEALVSPYDQSVRQQIALELLERYPEPDPEAATVDDVAEDEYQGIDESDWYKLRHNPNDDWQTRLFNQTAEEIVDQAISRPWSSEQVPALAKWVQQNKQPLDLLVEASHRPRYFSPSPSFLDGSKGMLIATLLPDVHMMRVALRALQVRAMWHWGEGRHEEAWQDLLACHRLARLVSENFSLVGQLVAMAIDGVACSNTSSFLPQTEMSLALAKRIQNDLNQLGETSSCQRALNLGERLSYLDAVVLVATSNDVAGDLSNLNGGSTPLDATAVAAIDWNVLLRDCNKWHDKMQAVAMLPSRKQRKNEFRRVENELTQLSMHLRSPSAWIGSAFNRQHRSKMVSNVFAELMLPAVTAAFQAEDRSRTHSTLTRLAAALAVYRAEQGEYPEKLEQLIPAVIPKLPLDMYSEKPFLYRRMEDGGYLLYSVFENGIDDRGTNMGGDIIDGEWVDQQPDGFDYDQSDLVIRVPVPTFKFPPPPDDDSW